MSRYGIIRFDSIPKNADVIIDNQKFGITPLDVEDVEDGNYLYSLSLDGYEDFTRNVIVHNNKIAHIVADLKNHTKTEEYITINQHEIDSLPLPEKKRAHEILTTQPRIDEETDVQQQILNQLILMNSKVQPEEEQIYFDVNNTITQTTLIAPTDPDSPSYDRETIRDKLQRNAKRVSITNDGEGNLFIRISHDGIRYSEEIPIYESDVKTYYDIWEVRLRADRIGCKYRITEYPLTSVTANVSKSEKIVVLSTVSTIHFIGTIFPTFFEIAHLHGQLLSNRIRIVSVNGQSMQPLKYRLIFWGSAGTQNTVVLNDDTYLTDIIMDFSNTATAFQLPPFVQYYLDVSKLDRLFDCFDQDYSLHIGLQNLEAVTKKQAGAAGAVQFDIKYAMRL